MIHPDEREVPSPHNMVIVFNFHPNALSAIYFMLLGIVISEIPAPQKHPPLISVTPSGILTEIRLSHSQKASLPIDVTLLGIWTETRF
jgi:hypothetical protein